MLVSDFVRSVKEKLTEYQDPSLFLIRANNSGFTPLHQAIVSILEYRGIHFQHGKR